MRDIALAASGLLNPKVGGPSIYAPIPESLLGAQLRAVDLERRDRPRPLSPGALHVPPPLAAVSGAAELRHAQRRFLLRAPAALEHAAASADDAQRSDLRRVRPGAGAADACDGGRERRRARDVRLPLVRRPRRRARPSARRWSSLLDKQQQRIAEGWIDAREIATGKNELPGDLPAGVTPAQLAAYTVVARVILNLDETITKE